MEKRLLFWAFVVILVLFGSVSPQQALAETEVLTPINANTIWDLSGSPYIIRNNILITPGTTLTIEPGVVVKFDPNPNYALSVQGTLNALGTSTEKIYFTSLKDDFVGGDTNGDGGATTPTLGDWSQIRVFEGANANMENVEIRYGGSSFVDNCGLRVTCQGGLTNQGGFINISNSRVFSNSAMGVFSEKGTTTISHSEIDNNEIGIRFASRFTRTIGGKVVVENSIISNSSDYGIYAYGTSDSVLIVNNNTFLNNERDSVFIALYFENSNNTSIGSVNGVFYLQSNLPDGMVLKKDNIPYALGFGGSSSVSFGSTVRVDPGAVIKLDENSSFNVYGNLDILGTLDEKVVFTSYKDDSVGGDTNGDGNTTSPAPGDWQQIRAHTGSNLNINNAILKYGGGFTHSSCQFPITCQGLVMNNGGNILITDSVLSQSFDKGVFHTRGGQTEITDTEIKENRDGIYIHSSPGIEAGVLSITNSSIYDNDFGIRNFSPDLIEAINNWWGDSSGPFHLTQNPFGLGNEVTDRVNFEPFLTRDPLRERSECCSSVVFLPGIKGSVLEYGSDQLWPPTILSNDIPQLALTEEGESVNPVVVNGIINNFYSRPVYEDFSIFMDDLVASSTIYDWLPLAYDWRFSPEKILEDGVDTPNGNIDILEEIEILASNSDTGKVTIVGHSMGGLMGKAIIKAFEDEGKEDLVDSFVMVGTPQIGTPQAIASILHGDSEIIGGGIITDRTRNRTIAQNMPGAYNLLPSQSYLDGSQQVISPVITFDPSTSFTQDWIGEWGFAVTNYEEFFSFVTGSSTVGANVLQRPVPGTNILKPEILSPDLLVNARDLHNTYDTYEFPSNINVYQVAGWGLPTVRTIDYLERHFVFDAVQTYDVKHTIEGDGTVVYSSATSTLDNSNVNTYFLNLEDLNGGLSEPEFKHYNLLRIDSIQSLIELIIRNRSVEGVDFVSDLKPEVGDLEDKLLVSSHSPVILGVYDSLGSFTGIDPNQDLSAEFLFITEEVPGSSYSFFGSSQYLFLPKNGNYTFVVEGVGSGPTTIEVDDFVNDTTTRLSSYTDILISTSTVATFDISGGVTDNVFINVDFNGDGNIDFVVEQDNEEQTLEELLQELKDTILGLELDSFVESALLSGVRQIVMALELGGEAGKKKSLKIIAKFGEIINDFVTNGNLLQEDADIITRLLDKINNNL